MPFKLADNIENIQHFVSEIIVETRFMFISDSGICVRVPLCCTRILVVVLASCLNANLHTQHA